MPPSESAVRANDFNRQWQVVHDDVLAAVDRVGRSGWLILGTEVAEFERDFAAWWGVPHAVGVASGLDALEISLRCAGLEAGEKVLTTPLTAFATTLAIFRAGGQPVWVDVDETGSVDLELADAALRADASIRFFMPVHLYGHPLDPDVLRRISIEHQVTVVEDCAQSAGAVRNSQPTGLVGVAAAVSLYPTKNLGAMGDGGVLLTGDEQLAERARSLRDYGQSKHYEHAELGLNSRLDELHAAILRTALLPRLSEWLARRRVIADRYRAGLAASAEFLRPVIGGGGVSASHLFPVEVLSPDPELVRQGLRERGIAVGRHYPVLCPDQPAAAGLGESMGRLPVAQRLALAEASLPINPFLSDAEVDGVIEACIEVARGFAG